MRFVLLIWLFLAPASSPAVEELPPASNVVRRLLERGQFVARAEQTNHYTYQKRSVATELDEKDRVIQSTEKLYQVVLIGGLPFQRLIKVQGRDLTPKELEKQNDRETAFRERVTRVDLKRKAKRREALATPELVDRFDFKVTRREVVEGRAALVLQFTPKRGASENTMEDKVFNHVSGTAWVDEEDAELVKLDASVRGPVPLGWFGAVGSLNKFDAAIQRSRMPDGVWVNRKSSFSIVARKLFTAMRHRTTEESSGFKRE